MVWPIIFQIELICHEAACFVPNWWYKMYGIAEVRRFQTSFIFWGLGSGLDYKTNLLRSDLLQFEIFDFRQVCAGFQMTLFRKSLFPHFPPKIPVCVQRSPAIPFWRFDNIPLLATSRLTHTKTTKMKHINISTGRELICNMIGQTALKCEWNHMKTWSFTGGNYNTQFTYAILFRTTFFLTAFLYAKFFISRCWGGCWTLWFCKMNPIFEHQRRFAKVHENLFFICNTYFARCRFSETFLRYRVLVRIWPLSVIILCP